MERNIYNLAEVDAFLAELGPLCYARHDIRFWLKRNLRNYLLREHDQLRELDSLPDDAPEWAKRDRALGRTIQRVCIGPLFRASIAHLIDLFHAKPWLRLERLAVSDAFSHAANWDRELKRQAAVAEDLTGILPQILYADGWSWVKLQSKSALQREGALMGHCVASYFGRSNAAIFSLRDRDNMPHVTLELRLPEKYLVQAKGKGNRRLEAGASYRSQLFHFIRQMECRLPERGCYDLTGYLLLPDGRLIDGDELRRFWRSDGRLARDCLLQLALWPEQSVPEAEKLWLAALEAATESCYLPLKNSLPRGALIQALLSPANIRHPWYEKMLEALLGVGSFALLPDVLEIKELEELLRSRAWLEQCCKVGRRTGELLGRSGRELVGLLGEETAFLLQAELQTVSAADFKNEVLLVAFLQLEVWTIQARKSAGRKLQELRDLLGRKLALSEAMQIALSDKVQGLLALLEPEPDRLSAKSFAQAGTPRLLAEYWNSVMPHWPENEVRKARLAAGFLLELAWPRVKFEELLARLNDETAATLLLRKSYGTVSEADEDLERLGFAAPRLRQKAKLWPGVFAQVPYLQEAAQASLSCADEALGGRRENLSRWLPALWVLHDEVGASAVQERCGIKDETSETIAALLYGEELLAEDLYRLSGRELWWIVRQLDNYNRCNLKLAQLFPYISRGLQAKLLGSLTVRRAEEIRQAAAYPISGECMARETAARLLLIARRLMESGEISIASDDPRFWQRTLLGEAWGSLRDWQKLLAHALWRRLEETDLCWLADQVCGIDADRQKMLLLALPYRLREELLERLAELGGRKWHEARVIADAADYLLYLQVAAETLGEPDWFKRKKTSGAKNVAPFNPPQIRRVDLAGLPELLRQELQRQVSAFADEGIML